MSHRGRCGLFLQYGLGIDIPENMFTYFFWAYDDCFLMITIVLRLILILFFTICFVGWMD